jgi:hypothetical protein
LKIKLLGLFKPILLLIIDALLVAKAEGIGPDWGENNATFFPDILLSGHVAAHNLEWSSFIPSA